MATVPSAPTPTIKLRDSCEGCALSKVKCHKQKPTCSRCARRNVPCHYLAIKRAGRRQDSQWLDAPRFTPTTAPAPQLEHFDFDAWFGTTSSSESNDKDTFLDDLIFSTPDTSSTTPSFHTGSSSTSTGSPEDLFLASLSSVSTPATATTNTTTTSSLQQHHNHHNLLPPLSPSALPMDLDDFFSPSATTISTPLWPPLPHTSLPASTSRSIPASTFSSPSQDTSLPTSTSLSIPPSTFSSPSQDTCPPHATCLSQTTHLLRSQFASPSPSPLSPLLAHNRNILSSLDTVLECECLSSGYLLTLISLVVIKLIESYAEAVEGLTSSDCADPGECADEESVAEGVRRVLGEMYRVQRVVGRVAGGMGGTMRCGEGGLEGVAFGGEMLTGVRGEMRGRLRGLVGELRGRLRGE